MARVVDQTVPAELLSLYEGALGTSEWVPDTYRVHQRIPFRLPRLQGCRTIRNWIKRGDQVSDPMCANRYIFGDCVKCFNKQPWSGGAEPAGYGGYSRTWWFTEAIGKLPWYFNYFMQQTMDAYLTGRPPNWCLLEGVGDSYTNEVEPTKNFGSLSFMWCGRTVVTSVDYRAYIHRPNPDWKTLHIYIYNPFVPAPDPNIVYLDAWSCSAAWTEGTIKYNNQPEPIIFLKGFVFFDGVGGWIEIPVSDAPAIVIVGKPYKGGFKIYSKDGVNPLYRPYWTA